MRCDAGAAEDAAVAGQEDSIAALVAVVLADTEPAARLGTVPDIGLGTAAVPDTAPVLAAVGVDDTVPSR